MNGQKFVYKFVSFPEIIKTETKIPFRVKMERMNNTSNDSSEENFQQRPVRSDMTGMERYETTDKRLRVGEQSERSLKSDARNFHRISYANSSPRYDVSDDEISESRPPNFKRSYRKSPVMLEQNRIKEEAARAVAANFWAEIQQAAVTNSYNSVSPGRRTGKV